MATTPSPCCLQDWIFPVVLALFLGVLSMFSGQVGWGIWDQNGVSLLVWLLKSGGQAYQTVFTAMPPLFVGGAWIASRLPAQYWAILAVNAGFGAGIFMGSWWLLRRAGMAGFWAMTLPFAVVAGTTVVTGFWWYNAATFAVQFLWICAVVSLERQPSRWDVGILGVMNAVILSAKPHTSLVLWASFVLYALLFQRRWLWSLPLTFGILAVLPVHWAGYFEALILNQGRAHFMQGLADHIQANWMLRKAGVPILAFYAGFSALFWSVSVARFGKDLRRWILGGGILIAGLLSFASDSILISECAGFWIGSLLVAGVGFADPLPKWARIWVCLGLASLMTLSGIFMVRHTRSHYTFDLSAPQVRIVDPRSFLEGQVTGTRLPLVLQELATAQRQCGWTSQSRIRFGPGLEFAYPHLGMIPPAPQVLYWEGFNRSEPLVTATIQAPVDAWVLAYSDLDHQEFVNHYPKDLLNVIHGLPVLFQGKTLIVYGPPNTQKNNQDWTK